jgi:hypothetical protein
MTSSHKQRPDRSPLHDVRHHARPRLDVGSARILVFHERVFKVGNAPSGGARRDRTDDLLLAKQALSQLSYGPDQRAEDGQRRTDKAPFRRLSSVFRRLMLVGLGRFELPTSRLSSARSNQLSYKPGTEISNQWSVIRKLCLITDYRLLTPDPCSFVKKEK